MSPEQFCYWLQGFFEITGVGIREGYSISEEEAKVIAEHLQKVFYRIKPEELKLMPNQFHDLVSYPEVPHSC